MKRKEVKVNSENPNEWMNYLSKNDIIIYPDYKIEYGGLFKIVVDVDGVKHTGSKFYSTKTINQGLIDALKYMFNKIKKNKL